MSPALQSYIAVRSMHRSFSISKFFNHRAANTALTSMPRRDSQRERCGKQRLYAPCNFYVLFTTSFYAALERKVFSRERRKRIAGGLSCPVRISFRRSSTHFPARDCRAGKSPRRLPHRSSALPSMTAMPLQTERSNFCRCHLSRPYGRQQTKMRRNRHSTIASNSRRRRFFTITLEAKSIGPLCRL